MIKQKNFLMMAVLLALSLIYLLYQNAYAGETERDLGNSKLRNIAKVIIPSDVSKENLKKVKKIAVLVSSPSQLFGETVADLLSIKLRDLFEVAEQTKVSEATWEEIRNFEKQGEKNKEKQQEEILNIIKIGEKLGLNAVFVGTVFEGRRQINFTEEKPPRGMEQIVVSTFYLQIVDVLTEKVMLSIILEYDKGENIINAVDIMTKIIKEEMKD